MTSRVDPKNVQVHEDFLIIIECDNGISGKALAEKIWTWIFPVIPLLDTSVTSPATMVTVWLS